MSIFRLALLFLMPAEIALAQNFDCDQILTKGLRNYEIQADSSAFLNSTFDNYCSTSGEAKSSAFNVGVDAIIKAVPVKFTLGSTDARTAVSNFCKTYKSDTSSANTSSRYRETIVQRAYDSFDSCAALSLNGNTVSHDVLSLDKVQIYLRAGIGKPVVVRGIDTSDNVKCSGVSNDQLVQYSEGKGGGTPLSMTINCTRKPDTGADGSKIYSEGTIALDIALGKYTIFLPRDARLPDNQASQIFNGITGLGSRLDQVEKKKIVCNSTEAQSPVSRGPAIVAEIPPGERAEWVVTGGGCDIPGSYGHNPPIVDSRATQFGWRCAAGDPPNIPLNIAVRAKVIYCKISAP